MLTSVRNKYILVRVVVLILSKYQQKTYFKNILRYRVCLTIGRKITRNLTYRENRIIIKILKNFY